MRKKETKIETHGVAAGFSFSSDSYDEENDAVSLTLAKEISNKQARVNEQSSQANATIDSNRNYSPYYSPKPKVGARGGVLGRGPVNSSERKIQFSVTCTPSQKERFIRAAELEKRKLPDFICVAIEEYIQNHNL